MFVNCCYYILQDNTPIVIEDLYTWANWMESNNKTVALSKFDWGDVSTVFLGMNHGCFPEEEPLLFETRIFKKDLTYQIYRYRNYNEAKLGHELICQKFLNINASIVERLIDAFKNTGNKNLEPILNKLKAGAYDANQGQLLEDLVKINYIKISELLVIGL